MKKSADQMAKGGTHMVYALKNDRWKAAIASMEGGGSLYDQTDAEGFLRILGLPSRVQGHVRPRG
jgi:hypothetical protein